MTVIGFIGIGTMGKGMVLNLAKNGFDVIAYNRSRNKVDSIANDKEKVKGNIKVADSLQDVTKADVIFTCLPNDEMIEEVFNKIKDSLSGKILIDCSSTSIELTQRIVNIAKEVGFAFIDAPLTGSKLGAENGTLMFMLGGNKELVDQQTYILKAMGKRFVYCGENTYGQRAKIALNITQAMVLESYLEGIVLAIKNGVPIDAIQEILENSGAKNNVASFKMPFIKNRDFEQHFMTKLMYKDVKLAEQEIHKLGLCLPLAEKVILVFQEAVKQGYGEEDFCAIVKVLEKMADIKVK